MKHPYYEKLLRKQKEYHRNNPWRLSTHGLYVPHCYKNQNPADLTWWDDVGFILNRRRVMVWWRHPRDVYRCAIEEQAMEMAGNAPDDDWLTRDHQVNYQKRGKSRKKIVSYTCGDISNELRSYFYSLKKIEEQLYNDGIDFEVIPSYSRQRLSWATGVDLVAPFEIRNETGLAAVSQLTRKLLLGKTTLDQEFNNNSYKREDWLYESPRRKK